MQPLGWWPTGSTWCGSLADQLATIIGDISGHEIEPAVTAFHQCLLQVFLRQFHRNPAQALELNANVTIGSSRLIACVWSFFDAAAGTLRQRRPAIRRHGSGTAGRLFAAVPATVRS